MQTFLTKILKLRMKYLRIPNICCIFARFLCAKHKRESVKALNC